ncbi:hypothetical protein V5799_017596 [Amblyomma americanum]|uniref:Uncharacterized protein n=1 Tax=Amblyomma americanum TaxID=6943 RepID=A0AAQ4F1R9_AMBAM
MTALPRVEAAVPHVAVRVPNPFDSDRPSQSRFSQAVADIVGGMVLGNAQPEDSDDGGKPPPLPLDDSIAQCRFPEREGRVMRAVMHSVQQHAARVPT